MATEKVEAALIDLLADVRQGTPIIVLAGMGGGLVGGIYGSLKDHPLSWSVGRPAALLSLFTASSLVFRAASHKARHKDNPCYDWKDTAVGVGWTSLFFARVLTGRPWPVLLPGALTTGLLVSGGVEAGTNLMTKVDPAWLDGSWLKRRWERIALLESRLGCLNDEISQLASQRKDT